MGHGMDLNQIVLFTRVVETGSFTAAAKALGLPVSSVSRGVVHLEESLGTRLLQRTTRKLNLTDAGRHFFEQSVSALESLGQAVERVAESTHEAQGTVRITIPMDLGDSFLVATLADFNRMHPKVRVEVELQNRRVDLIEEGFDLALRGGKLEDSSLVGRKIADTELGVYASEEYLARHGTPARLSDLAEHECLCLRAMASTWTLDGPNGAESVKVRGPLISNDLSFLTRAAAFGLGLAVLPTSLMLSRARAGFGRLFVRVLPEYSHRHSALWLLWPSARHLPLRVVLLRDHLLAAFEQLQRDCEAAVATACALERKFHETPDPKACTEGRRARPAPKAKRAAR
jgi:DNA-binding transcriptional LysR family regulator